MDVLLVENDDLVRDCLEVVLTDAGLATTCSDCAETALRAISAGARPQLIVTDIDLGDGMDGLAFGAVSRRHYPGLPVVYISGRTANLPELAQEERFLAKPFRGTVLLRTIGELIKMPGSVLNGGSVSGRTASAAPAFRASN